MKIVFTCGGTGGHINPALAVANLFRSQDRDVEILFVGAEHGLERDLVTREGYSIETLPVTSLRHNLKPKSFVHNAKSLVNMQQSITKVQKILKDFNPDIVVGTGGYASFPAVKAAQKLGIPTIIHESNAIPGVTTTQLAKKATRVLVSYEGVESEYPYHDRVVVTGTPVKKEFILLDKMKCKRELGLDNRPLIVSFYGSQGAKFMNERMADIIADVAKTDSYNVIHACGKFGWKWMPDLIVEKGVQLKDHNNIRVQEYIFNMPTVMVAADLIICRGGASTLSEVEVAGKPAIIVPSPNVVANHQEKNARKLEQSGGVIVCTENQLDSEKLNKIINELLQDREKLDTMSKALGRVAILDAAERIYNTIKECCNLQK